LVDSGLFSEDYKPKFKNLKKIDLSYNFNLTSVDFLNKIFNEAINLTELDIQYSFLNIFSNNEQI
jgi:hypothetical protein